ncbi:MAG: flagellar biosynthesis protein FliQ [Clostridiales bacterium]|jgi:flagellar biosynthetic protein FliQ|nr:flagellar biosynthesis protein FliQ [Clostridiales bacterium]
MSQDQVLSIFKEALWITLQVAGPVLIISIIVGLVISVIQAATQIHEQTLTFVPKLIAIALVLLLTGTWVMNVMNDFTKHIFEVIANIV